MTTARLPFRLFSANVRVAAKGIRVPAEIAVLTGVAQFRQNRLLEVTDAISRGTHVAFTIVPHPPQLAQRFFVMPVKGNAISAGSST